MGRFSVPPQNPQPPTVYLFTFSFHLFVCPATYFAGVETLGVISMVHQWATFPDLMLISWEFISWCLYPATSKGTHLFTSSKEHHLGLHLWNSDTCFDSTYGELQHCASVSSQISSDFCFDLLLWLWLLLVWEPVNATAHVEVIGQPAEVCSLLPPCGSYGWNVGGQPWPSQQPCPDLSDRARWQTRWRLLQALAHVKFCSCHSCQFLGCLPSSNIIYYMTNHSKLT